MNANYSLKITKMNAIGEPEPKKNKTVFYAKRKIILQRKSITKASSRNKESNSKLKLVTMIRKVKPEPPDPNPEEIDLSTSNLCENEQTQATIPSTIKEESDTNLSESNELSFIENNLKHENDQNEEVEYPIQNYIHNGAEMTGNISEGNYMYERSSSSSSEDEEDNRLAEQFLQLEQKYQEKEAQAHLVTKTKLEALEAGIKFLGALFNMTGLGSLKVPVSASNSKEVTETVPSSTMEEEIEQPSSTNIPEIQITSPCLSNLKTVPEEEFDLGVFNPAELTRKMKQFISQEDMMPESSKKKHRRTKKIYKQNKRHEFAIQNWEPSGKETLTNTPVHKNCSRKGTSSNTPVKRNHTRKDITPYTPVNESIVNNRRNSPRYIPILRAEIGANRRRQRRPNHLYRVESNNKEVEKEVKEKQIEMNAPSIDLPITSVSTEGNEERNQRLIELSNATGSQSIKHQMMRNSCIDDLFQSSLFHNSDL